MSADFLDSNVFLYLLDAGAGAKHQIARDLVSDALRSGRGQISYQVVQETLNVITRKFAVAVSASDARRFLDQVLVPLWRVMPSEALYQRALDVRDRYGFSFYDCVIVAAALISGCTRLVSEDLQDHQRIEGLTVVNPFVTR